MQNGSKRGAVMAGFFCIIWNASSQAQVFAYPNLGQSEEQQSRDRFECHQWSVSQTGFDPTTAPPLPPRQAVAPLPPPNPGYSDYQRQQPRSRGFLGIGDGGFFEGGGLVGDAGQGAAIGALASTVFGAVSRSSSSSRQPPPDHYEQQRQQQQYYQQQQQAQADQMYLERQDRVAEYNRAYSACMRSRDYTVN